MLSRLAIVAALLLTLAGCDRESYSRSNTGFSSLEKKDPSTPPSRAGRGCRGRRCDRSDDPLRGFSFLPDSHARLQAGPEANAPGQIVPAIRGLAEGSFTAAGLKQSVYLIDVGECSHDPVFSTRRLAVFTAGALTSNLEAPMGTGHLRAYDLNGDGKSELLLQGGHTGRGEWIEVARLVEFDKDKLMTVEDFGQIYDDTCDTDVASKSISASVVYYLPPPAGQKPRFTVELYRAPCPAKGRAPPQWARFPPNKTLSVPA